MTIAKVSGLRRFQWKRQIYISKTWHMCDLTDTNWYIVLQRMLKRILLEKDCPTMLLGIISDWEREFQPDGGFWERVSFCVLCLGFSVLTVGFVSGPGCMCLGKGRFLCPQISMILLVNVHSPEFQSFSETQVVMKGGLLVCLLASSVGFFISFLGGIFIGDYPLAYITEDYTDESGPSNSKFFEKNLLP